MPIDVVASLSRKPWHWVHMRGFSRGLAAAAAMAMLLPAALTVQ